MLPSLFGTARTKEILQVNPTIVPTREEAKDVKISVYEYNATSIQVYIVRTVIISVG
jgi:magnesium transporter